MCIWFGILIYVGALFSTTCALGQIWLLSRFSVALINHSKDAFITMLLLVNLSASKSQISPHFYSLQRILSRNGEENWAMLITFCKFSSETCENLMVKSVERSRYKLCQISMPMPPWIFVWKFHKTFTPNNDVTSLIQ